MSGEIPQKWTYWRHYKSKGWLDHVYQFLWTGGHPSEKPDKANILAIYRLLYQLDATHPYSDVDFATRLLSEWYDQVEYEGKKIQRFTQLSVQEILDLHLWNTQLSI